MVALLEQTHPNQAAVVAAEHPVRRGPRNLRDAHVVARVVVDWWGRQGPQNPHDVRAQVLVLEA